MNLYQYPGKDISNSHLYSRNIIICKAKVIILVQVYISYIK